MASWVQFRGKVSFFPSKAFWAAGVHLRPNLERTPLNVRTAGRWATPAETAGRGVGRINATRTDGALFSRSDNRYHRTCIWRL